MCETNKRLLRRRCAIRNYFPIAAIHTRKIASTHHDHFGTDCNIQFFEFCSNASYNKITNRRLRSVTISTYAQKLVRYDFNDNIVYYNVELRITIF
jgi:hypothetical protein